MAWNEPGGGNQKDPWGGGGNDQGPPDLDEAFKKLQDKLNGVLGGGNGSSGSGGGFSPAVLIVGLVIAILGWLAMGVYQIDQKERGVVLRFGEYLETVQPGLHWNPALIDQVTKVNVTQVRSYSVQRATMLTEDQNIVQVSLSVQYTVSDPKDFILEVFSPSQSLQHATESALRHVVGSSEMHSILTEGREQIGVAVQQRLQEYLDSYNTGIQVSKVNIDDTRAPEAVQAAFDDVIKAKEDEERVKNEAESYKNGIIPEARGKAKRLEEEALGYKKQVIAKAEGDASRFTQLLTEYERAPEVTRRRLYLDTVESIMEKTNKVVVDVEGGNNMMYLPLDQLTRSAQKQEASPVEEMSDQNVRQLTDRVVQQIRRQASRVRESR